jgi:hypothetical protein
MPDNFDHLQWTRLEVEPPFRTRLGFGSRRRLRSDPCGHGGRLLGDAESAVAGARANRPLSGIDPARLLVLRLRFLDDSHRDLLARLGIDIVDEREERQAVESPYYELSVEFAVPAMRDGFRQYPDPTLWGVSGIGEVRASGGGVDERRLTLLFPDLERARAFQQPGHAGCPIPMTVRGKEQKVSATTASILTVQFPDHAAIDRFLTELRARRDGDTDTLTLTGNQRADLFDALEQIDHRGPDDRRGQRLQESGEPQSSEFTLDVDLWHPGPVAQLPLAIQQFRDMVDATAGQVTGSVRPVMNTLLIARVRGNRRTLEALLNYDRVSRVDLPPRLEPVQFTIFDSAPVQAQPLDIPVDGPLACVLDSGVVPGHPLLRDLVLDSEDFQSGEDTPFDRIGHGTHVGGVVAYGDTWALLQSGQPWKPQVRLLNAKVLRRMEEDGGRVVWPGFSDLERAEAQIEDAVRRFAQDPDRRCKVFNLSLGNDALKVGQGHQLPWALLLDQLARELDIVLVVSAGNVTPPRVPHAPTEDDLRCAVRDQLFTDDHILIDPACAVNALTVGAISRLETPHNPSGRDGRPDPVGSPRNCPAPFTRAGLLAGSGTGAGRAVKLELVAYGGNLSLMPHGRWRFDDPVLGEPSLNFDFTNRLLSAATGTSVAAPYVTHVCALIEYRMRQLNGGRPISANLIRALATSGAVVPVAGEGWLGQGWSDAQANRRVLRTLGYGKPEPYRSCYSDKNRAVLYAEDALAERCFHLYRFELPAEFLETRGTRCIRLALAYDPPVRGTRLEYMSRTMTLQLFRGVTDGQIQNALADLDGDAAAVPLPDRTKRLEPQIYEWSTVQCAESRSKDIRSFLCADDDEGSRSVWHVLVGCKHRFPTPETAEPQRYALVLSVEHSDERVQVYQPLRVQMDALRAQVEERTRTRARSSGI